MTTALWLAIGIPAGLLALLAAAFAAAVRARNLDRWIVPYILQTPRRRPPRPGETVHALICVADHYEPLLDGADPELAMARVARWVEDYPKLCARFRDVDGRPPQHSFFVPIDEYVYEHVEAIAGLCRAGLGEVEVHLHHDDDTSESTRKKLEDFKHLLHERHGMLGRRRDTGELAYAFIHGNWALDNSLKDGKRCGVNDELTILRETGCFVDMTLPSAPSTAQVATINSIYYAVDDPSRPRSHEYGTPVGTAPRPPDSLMLIQGPLLFDWSNRVIENSCLQGTLPATRQRLDLWLKARVQIPTRPDWFFIKLHTHGAPEWNAKVLLGDEMSAFHQALADRAAADPNFHYHYVTAREMYNLARAAEAGWAGTVDGARDFEIVRDRGELAGAPAGADAAARS